MTLCKTNRISNPCSIWKTTRYLPIFRISKIHTRIPTPVPNLSLCDNSYNGWALDSTIVLYFTYCMLCSTPGWAHYYEVWTHWRAKRNVDAHTSIRLSKTSWKYCKHFFTGFRMSCPSRINQKALNDCTYKRRLQAPQQSNSNQCFTNLLLTPLVTFQQQCSVSHAA